MHNDGNINIIIVQCSYALFDIKAMKSLCNVEPMINIFNIVKLKVYYDTIMFVFLKSLIFQEKVPHECIN